MAMGVQGRSLLGEKFTCLICGQEDLSEEEMRTHVLLEHVECNTCCPFCDLSGITSDEMNLHINSVHFDDMMSPVEKTTAGVKEMETDIETTETDKETDEKKVGREDAERFGREHGGAIPKTPQKSALKHSHSLDHSSPTHGRNGTMSPRKSSGMKMSQSETSISSKRGKLQLNFATVNVPASSVSSQCVKSSSSMHGSLSSHSMRTSSSSSNSNSMRASTSYDGLQTSMGSSDSSDVQQNGGIMRFSIHSQNDVIMEEVPAQDNNNVPLQPNFNQTLLPDINDNIEPDINSNMPAGFSCPLCQFITSSENLIQTHVNMAHVDVLSPARAHQSSVGSHSIHGSRSDSADASCATENGVKSFTEYPCPICMQIFDNAGELSLHVNQEHSNIFSPDKADYNKFTAQGATNGVFPSTSSLACPVCELVFYDRFKLESHVNGHFSAEQTPVQERNDKLIAQVLQEKEKDIVSQQEEKDFQKLQAMYGMVDGTPYKKQYEKNLDKAVADGDLTVVEYHERKNGFKQADSRGMDDTSSCTKGVVQRLQEYYRTPTHGVSRSWLCTGVDHFSGSYGDKGWGCGYRNFQMLLSSLMMDQTYLKVVFNGRPIMPSIPKIQRLIESAWDKGYDKQGCDQLGGRVFNTTKWIGATEIVATLASLKVKCKLLDFHSPSGPNGTHPKLFEWVKAYFEKPAVFRPPLYLQHQGHSRTIVGIEELKNKQMRLLIFDPSTPKKQMQLFHSIVNANIMRTLRRSQDGLKAKQYQIVAVAGIISETDVTNYKILKSERIS